MEQIHHGRRLLSNRHIRVLWSVGSLFILLLLAATARLGAQDSASPGAGALPEGETLPGAGAGAAYLREVYAGPSDRWPAPTVDEGVAWSELGLLPDPPHPADNPPTAAKVELGRHLFFDARLSGSGQMACISCHAPELAWADGRTVSFGHGVNELRRNSQTIENAAHHEHLFWDGRAKSIEDQAERALLDPHEMRGDAESIVAFLKGNEGYREKFAEAFDGEEPDLTRATQAIATFVRSVNGGRSRFDRFLRGEHDVLEDAAIRGLHLFRTTARCMNCHHGPLMADGQFHDLGLSYYGRKLEDLGRFHITGDPADVGRFRTPSLRNVGRTAPYMHNGLFQLEGVLNMYNAGMPTLKRKPEQAEDPLFPTKSHLLQPLELSRDELADLAAFLRSLDEPLQRVRPPELLE